MFCKKHYITVCMAATAALCIQTRHLAVIGERNRLAQQLGKAHGHRRKTEFFLPAGSWACPMACQRKVAAIPQSAF